MINTKPRNENLVCRFLESESFRVFLPTITARNLRRRRRSSSNKQPLFPGYIFTRIDLDQPGWARINYTPGVRKIVSYGSQPVAVPEPILDEIKARLRGNRPIKKSMISFKAGDKVKFLGGPFEGLEGIFTGTVSGKERVKVLMELLRQSVQVEAEISCLEKVSAT